MLTKIKKLIKKIRNILIVRYVFLRYRKCTLIWVYPHIGDMFYALPYVGEYKRRNGVKTVLVGNKRYKKYYGLFSGIDYYCLLSEDCVWAFSRDNNFSFFKRYLKSKVEKGKFITNDFDLISEYVPIEKEISLQEYTKAYIYHLPKGFSPIYPTIQNSNRKYEKDFVIISPYAQTVKTIDISLFKDFVRELRTKGYLVLTNVHGDEKEIEGTLRLDCSLFELCEYSSNAKAFISVRSGVSDMVAATTNVDLFVIFNGYVRGHFASVKDYRKNSNNIHEYFDDFEPSILSDILTKIS